MHAAHGSLVSQFLSPLINQRTDRWGGSAENRARFLHEAVREVRRQVSPKFAVSVKLNSADFQRGGFTEEDSLEVVKLLSGEGVDLLEISGGSYEQPVVRMSAWTGLFQQMSVTSSARSGESCAPTARSRGGR